MRPLLNFSLVLAMGAIAASCGPPSAVPNPTPLPIAPSACDVLSPLPSNVANPYNPSPDGHEVAVTKTLFSRVPVGQQNSEELFMAMVKDSIPGPQEAVYFLIPPPTPQRVDRYRVVHVRAVERVPRGGPAIQSTVSESVLDAQAVSDIERVWAAMTGAARWPNRDESLRTASKLFASVVNPNMPDYTFDYRGDNVYFQAGVFAPDRQSCSAGLAAIGELLMRFADETDEHKRRALRGELLSQAAALRKRLRIQDASLCGGAPCRTDTLSKGARK